MTPTGLENMQNYLVPAAGTTHGFRFTGNLVLGEPVEISFRDYELNGRSFAPSGVLIDNTLGTADMVVTIVEFQFRLICKKGNTLMLPYPAPLNQTARIEGEGPITAIFVDYPVQPYSTAGGSGGGPTPSGGRSTMFHGFNGAGVASSPPVSIDTNVPIIAPTIDPDGWLVGTDLVVPAGVEMIRIGALTQAIAGSERPAILFTIAGFNFFTGQNSSPMAYEYVDTGPMAVTPGDTITFTVNPGTEVLTAAGGVIFIEVLQGAILAT